MASYIASTTYRVFLDSGIAIAASGLLHCANSAIFGISHPREAAIYGVAYQITHNILSKTIEGKTLDFVLSLLNKDHSDKIDTGEFIIDGGISVTASLVAGVAVGIFGGLIVTKLMNRSITIKQAALLTAITVGEVLTIFPKPLIFQL